MATDCEKYRAEAERLFKLLDNIDSLDDACKYDPTIRNPTDREHQRAGADLAFRRAAMELSRKRFDGPIDTDGYTLEWSDGV